ncbi:LysR family transcriptional regulator [Rhodobacteraceae bacterium 2CG4]|uniref:LysR family transcriptional regulator n=1 Tax=Halovulum marinum TaxID=2662447 RepID=A0A6L5YWW6_9RHOB|nr:LysR family transcriptional regulator [Halovulum marinum]MSU88708.1 LysR family transcriptional regulator [Halovulum marinum]
MMKLTGLPQFQAVCSTRNLTVAAQLLGVSQPALTQAIGKLERQLGVPLLDRSTRPLRITPYGEALLSYARTLERNTEELAARIEAMKTGSGGTLSVGAGPDWIHELLPVAIARMQEDQPDMRIRLIVALNDDLRARLDAGELDMFFASVADPHFGAAYETRILLQEEMQVIARTDHPIHAGGAKSLATLAGERWVMTQDETFGRQLLRRLFGKAGVTMPLPAVETNSVRAMSNILRSSRMLGFLSRTHTLAYSELAPVPTSEPMPMREGGVTWRRDAPLLPAAERFIAQVESVIAEQGVRR